MTVASARPTLPSARVVFVTTNDRLAARHLRALARPGLTARAIVPEQAAAHASSLFADVFIIDMNVPGGGIDLCRTLRNASADAYLIALGPDNEIGIVVALEVGADDYAVLPCSPREMRARVQAAVRRLAIERGEDRD